jgi:hypothetical protein
VSFHGFLGGARPAIKHPRHATAAKFAARALQLAFLRRGHRLLRDHALVAHANGHGLTGGRVARVSGGESSAVSSRAWCQRAVFHGHMAGSPACCCRSTLSYTHSEPAHHNTVPIKIPKQAGPTTVRQYSADRRLTSHRIGTWWRGAWPPRCGRPQHTSAAHTALLPQSLTVSGSTLRRPLLLAAPAITATAPATHLVCVGRHCCLYATTTSGFHARENYCSASSGDKSGQQHRCRGIGDWGGSLLLPPLL